MFMNHNDKLISEVIKFLRFPLIVCVVMIHSHFQNISMGGLDYGFDIQTYPIYCNISFFLSKIISSIAVPLFFIFSGYLFFKNVSSFTPEEYFKKLHKRIRTLLMPYIFWNIVVILIYLVAQTIMPNMISGNNKLIADYTTIDWIKAFWNYHNEMPICYQFWFIRDLMVVVLLSPIIYFAIKKIRFFFVLIMGIIWLLNINTGITGVSITAIFFFSIGALFSITQYDIICFLNKIKFLGYIMSFILIIVEMCLYNYRGSIDLFFSDIQSIMLYKLCTLSLIVSCLNITVTLLRGGLLKTNEFLYDSNFFIYAYHTMPLVLFLKLIIRFLNPTSDIHITLVYFIVPIITILFGLMFFAVIRRIFPRFTRFITGSRI